MIFYQQKKIPAIELEYGDVSFIHSVWTLVLNASINEGFDNHGSNLEIEKWQGGISYLSPKHIVKIIKRDALDTHGVKIFIGSDLESQRLREEEIARYEEEERLEEIANLKERLKRLESGDDD